MTNDAYEPFKNASIYGMKVNPKAEVVTAILYKLGTMEERYGKPYCPCQANRTEDTICPCRYMRKNHVCRCGMFVPN